MCKPNLYLYYSIRAESIVFILEYITELIAYALSPANSLVDVPVL